MSSVEEQVHVGAKKVSLGEPQNSNNAVGLTKPDIQKEPVKAEQEAKRESYLCAQQYEKELYIIVQMGHKLEISSVVGFLPNQEPGLDVPHYPHECQRDSKKTWLLLSCAADFNPEFTVRNHWLPCYFKEQLTEMQWTAMTQGLEDQLDKDIAPILTRLHEIEIGEEDADPDPEVWQAILMSIQVKLRNLQNLKALVQRCKNEGVCLLPVASDGNCMVWSLKALTLQETSLPKFDSDTQLEEMMRFRWILQNMWSSVKKDPYWQALFKQIYPEHLHKPPPPSTPPRDSQKKHPKSKLSPQATEKPESLKRKVEVLRAGDARPVQKPVAAVSEVPKLKSQEQAQAEKLLEPKAPDLEETYLSSLMVVSDQGKPDKPGKFSLDDLDEDDSEDGRQSKIRRRQHTRACRSKDTTSEDRKHKFVKSFLAERGMRYGSFMSFHKQFWGCKNTGACDSGGYVAFQRCLLSGELPKCTICQEWAKANGITNDQLRMLGEAECPLSTPALQDQNDSTEVADGEKNQGSTEAADDEKKGETDADEPKAEAMYDTCVRYVRSFAPMIELIDEGDGRLKFRCTVCKTKRYPDGKINKLGRPKINHVRHFLQQHMDSDSHIANAKKAQQEQHGNVSDGPNPDHDWEEECEGYCVSNPESPGTLKLFAEEFGIWCTHAKMEGKAKHTYWYDVNTNSWHVRHQDCPRTFPNTGKSKVKLCKLCEDLGGPKSIQRLVARFLGKYYSAMLLNKRLFGEPEEVDDLLEMINSRAFGIRYKGTWEQMVKLPLLQMQIAVRKGWTAIPDGQLNANLTTFINMVVNPALKVNVASVNSNLVSLSARFASALQNKRLNAP